MAFCELLEKLVALPGHAGTLATLDSRIETLADIARQFRDCGPSNFLYADGDALFVHADQRYQAPERGIAAPALHLFECQSDDIPGLVCDAARTDGTDAQRVVMLSTAPLSKHSRQALDRGQLLALRDGVIVARGSL